MDYEHDTFEDYYDYDYDNSYNEQRLMAHVPAVDGVYESRWDKRARHSAFIHFRILLIEQ